MADFSKFSDGTNTYNVKDVSARAALPVETTKCKPEGSWWEACEFIGTPAITNMYGRRIWTDGTDIYYSPGNGRQCVLDKSTYTWVTKTWSGLSTPGGVYVWTDGTDIYHSNNNNQYVLNKSTSTWTAKAWNGLSSFDGREVWTDGTDIYYSYNGTNKVLDKATSTWSDKTWSGYSSVNGSKIWTDGTDIYYSYNGTNKVLDKATSTWSDKTWSGYSSVDGAYVWTDGTDIYYSYGSDQYILDKSTSTWTAKAWNGLSSFDGREVWTDGTDIYYSEAGTQKVLDKSTFTWNDKPWVLPGYVNGQHVWADGVDIYYSYDNDQYVFNKATSTWSDKTWNGLSSFRGLYIWTDGTDIYYSYDSTQKVLDKSTSTWNDKTWNGLTSFKAWYVWTDGTDIYYSEAGTQKVLDKSTSTWNDKTWSGYNSIYGTKMWTDGTDIYYSHESGIQKVLDKSTSTWATKTWNGLTMFNGFYVWTDGTDIYYSDKSLQFVLDKSTSTWVTKTWSGLTNFNGTNIWTDGIDIYYSEVNHCILRKFGSSSMDSYKNAITSLNTSVNTLTTSLTDISSNVGTLSSLTTTDKSSLVAAVNEVNSKANDADTDIGNIKAAVNSGNMAGIKSVNCRVAPTYEQFEPCTFNGYTQVNGSNVWTDGDNIYYSLNANQYVFDKSTSTWNAKTWSGLTSFFGNNVWTDGTNIYYSNTTSQYILNKSTSTWNTKTWSGMTSFYGNSIWTDGTDIYYSYDTTQRVLDKSTSTWSTKIWNGSYTPDSANIWTDGENIYGGSQYVLDKSTSTWNTKSWIAPGSFSGHSIWTDGENIYYFNSNDNYVLDKATSTWTVTDVGHNNFYGYCIWTDGTNIYHSKDGENYVLRKYAVTNRGYSGNIIPSPIGTLSSLTTTDKSNLVSAVNEVNDIVGSTQRNLYIGSPSFDGYIHIQKWTKSDETLNGHDVYYKNSLWDGMHNLIYLKTGTYTFSVMAKTAGGQQGGTATLYIDSRLGTLVKKASFNVDQLPLGTLTTEFAKYSMTFSITVSGFVAPRIELSSGSDTLYISEYQLEKGDTATEYQPYEGDILPRVDALEASVTADERYINDVNANVGTLSAKTSDIYAILGTYGDDVYGLQVDYENYIYTRLAGAAGKSREFFDTVAPWKDMKRCNLADDGTVNAYYGDNGYIEDGTNGQVMVEIPKFYYKMTPLKLEPIGDSLGGYHTRKANYYISATKYEGFKTHPAFVKPDGTERDKVYVSAYEGCIYDVSASAYLLADEQVGDFTATTGDKLSSIANAKPCSGSTQNLTRANSEVIATNRGAGWHCMEIKAVSALQLLFMVEYATLNSQNAIGLGVINASAVVNTGQTSSLGNASGMASGTAGLVSVSYRGVENFWGNSWTSAVDVNIAGDGSQYGNIPYICDDYNYTEDTTTGYTSVGFSASSAKGYVSAFGYNANVDWLFFPSESGNSASNAYPIGDVVWINIFAGYRVVLIGGSRLSTREGGAYAYSCSYQSTSHGENIGARLSYLP